ncbi:hypothetical protein HPB50_005222 [Hyalomma asiaticum]|uniref:Uncharacterized protein n=1 Tax=Hyalomma asiaticum TaxID=266040 RepID=A0ACB7SL38_HYAAI|nr:hypothetical protein HPB50_005222 [Hyalomma asiaticum]
MCAVCPIACVRCSVAHRIKKAAARASVNVVYSAPLKLGLLCRKVNSNPASQQCKKKHDTYFVPCKNPVTQEEVYYTHSANYHVTSARSAPGSPPAAPNDGDVAARIGRWEESEEGGVEESVARRSAYAEVVRSLASATGEAKSFRQPAPHLLIVEGRASHPGGDSLDSHALRPRRLRGSVEFNKRDPKSVATP